MADLTERLMEAQATRPDLLELALACFNNVSERDWHIWLESKAPTFSPQQRLLLCSLYRISIKRFDLLIKKYDDAVSAAWNMEQK